MQGFRNWIFSEDKKPYFQGTNNLIQEGDKDTLLRPDGQPAQLQHAPDGWKDALVKYGRSLTYMGLIREMTVPMKFVKDGAKILRYIFWTKAKNAIAYFAMHKLNRLVYPLVYDTWFYGELDFSTFKQTNYGVSIQVMEGGLSKLLRAGENTVYEIPINTDPDRRDVYLDGLPFTNKILYTVYTGQEITAGLYWLGIGIIDKSGITQGIIVQDVMFEQDILGQYPNNNYALWSMDKSIVAKVNIIITAACTHGSGEEFIVRIHRANDYSNALPTVYDLNPLPTYNNGQTFQINVSVDIPVGPHQRLHIFIGTSGGTAAFIVYNESVTIEYDVRFDASIAEYLTPFISSTV